MDEQAQAIAARVREGGLLPAGEAGRRAAVGRAGLGLPARPRGAAGGPRACERAARAPRPARGRGRRGRGALRAARRRARRPARRRAPAAARRRAGKPAGLGARRALRGRRAARGGASGAAGGGPHRKRSGRDDPLPARRIAGAPRAARDARRARPARPPAAASGHHAGGDRGTGAWRAASPGARTRPISTIASRAGACAADLLPALRAVHPAAEDNVIRTAAILREEAEVLDVVVATALAGRDQIALEHLAELPPALARLVVRRLAEDATGRAVCARVSASRRPARARPDGLARCRRRGARRRRDGVLRFERTPPLRGSAG